MPRFPLMARIDNTSRFYGPGDDAPLVASILMGIQHFLAVVGGIITPSILISDSGITGLNLDFDSRQFMVSTSLIVSGIMSLIQVSRFRIPGTRFYLGTGLLQIAGVSIANVAASQTIIRNMYTNGTIQYLPCPDAFGAILGTQMVCALVSMGISLLPPKMIRRLFPKMVTGVVLTVIGANLLGIGMTAWAGGSGSCMGRPISGPYMLCPDVKAPNAQPWGGAVNFGLGASVFFTIVVIEMIGSIFLKNISVALSVSMGCLIAISVGMFDGSGITAAPVTGFLWAKHFKFSVYGPGIVPFLFAQMDMIVETLGDVTAVSDLSGLPIEGEEFDQRCQGGLLAGGLGGVLSGLGASLGVVSFSQSNGAIAITRFAHRSAAVVCALLLISCGVFSKVAATFLAIPAPLIGGMTVFLFGAVAASGMRILGFLRWTRRERVIVMSSLAIALGVTLVPNWFSYILPHLENTVLQSVLSAIATIANTSYIMAGTMSIFLNLVLPYGAISNDSAEVKARATGGALRSCEDPSTEKHDIPLEELAL
ncbi:permease family-domain-containing protein [Sporodiniella umbellata]|nr:permease family-domain-containing protein [Sporodiniella umbellata]